MRVSFRYERVRRTEAELEGIVRMIVVERGVHNASSHFRSNRFEIDPAHFNSFRHPLQKTLDDYKMKANALNVSPARACDPIVQPALTSLGQALIIINIHNSDT